MFELLDNENKHIIDSEYTPESRIVLHTGDSYDFIKSLPDNLIKLIITSPPYNIGKEYEAKTSIENYLESYRRIIGEMIRVLALNGSICWQVGNYVDKGEVFPLDIFYYNIFKTLGMRLRNRIIWYFGHGLHASKRFSGRYETILWFTKTDEYTFNLNDVRIPSKYPGKRYYKGEKRGQLSGNPLGKNPADIWEFLKRDWDMQLWDIPNVKSNHPEKTSHPCQFPIELVERCVLALTDEGDWVLDPFAGVASSAVGALMHNRKAICVDKEEVYIDTGIHRIRDLFNGSLRIRPLGREVYKPTGREKISQIPIEWQ